MMVASGESFSGSYPACVQSVPRARAELTAFAAAAGVTGERLDAVRLASSEALTNAVLHAYREGSAGVVHVSAWHVPDELWVLVGDDGAGAPTRRDRRGLGLGLALIAQMADELEILSRPSGGTEVRMRFTLEPARRPPGRPPPPATASARSPR